MVQLARVPRPLQAEPDPGRLSTASRTWIALRTKSRQEKAVARCVRARDIEYYLPLIEKVSSVRGRMLRTKVPVFPGYVFLRGELDDAYDEALSPRICQIITIRDQQRFSLELAQVKRALESPVAIELYPFAARGRRCRVARGPLQGVEGVVLERKNAHRLVLQVDIIGQGVALEIDAGMLEALE